MTLLTRRSFLKTGLATAGAACASQVPLPAAAKPKDNVRIFLLAAIVVTGLFRVLKNMPDVVFSPGFTMFIDISHLGFMMLLMGCGIVFGITRRGWLVPRIA